ncbi:carboxymuconolactone decarboxylase family protein [Paraburkholderia sediminicola]|uniref:carboxymuconolactone decarboxylase family protein n=1 Tax=Paraburkholderia sediminicola TaxID=458836 RepID=UPI0038B82A6F
MDKSDLVSSSPTLDDVRSVSSVLELYTTSPLLGGLWKRPQLSPRDRSRVTVCALVATGQVAQITHRLNRAMDNGLTKVQVSEAMTQLAFYAGWPKVFSALPTVKDVLEKRAS